MAASETVQGIIDSIREHRTRFEAFCRSLSEEELARPVPNSDWIVKDFASHLTTLDPEIIRSLEATVAGKSEGPQDLDAFNEEQVVARREWPMERILEEGVANRAELIAAMERLTDEDIAKMVHFWGDAKRSPADLPLRVFLLGWALHDPIHVVDMLRALPERAEDAELQAWVTHPVIEGYQRAMAGPPRR